MVCDNMNLNQKNMKFLLDDIRSGRSVLFLGQDYFTIDDVFFNNVLKELNIYDAQNIKSLNELWIIYRNNTKTLGEAILAAVEKTEYHPWFRAILSLGWNAVLSSSVNFEWMKKNVGCDFQMSQQVYSDVASGLNPNRDFDKKRMKLISLFGDENHIPAGSELAQLKKNTALLERIYTDILAVYGILVIDGISDDDWHSVNTFLYNLVNVPAGCIYFFGMTKERLLNIASRKDDTDAILFEEYLASGQIILEERGFKEIVEVYDLITEEDELSENSYSTQHENEVRISLGDNDCIWIPRKDITQLKNIGITVMRDEILLPMVINDNNKQTRYAEFVQQRHQKNWGFYDIIYQKEKMSFHVPRHSESILQNAIFTQLSLSQNKRSIILLNGFSNSGKTTSLSWMAWHLMKHNNKDRSKDKYIVYYISGNPSLNDFEWKAVLLNFIKETVNDKTTVKGDRIRNNIIIWDNYSSQEKKNDYIELYHILNECNTVLVGSTYTFEAPITTNSKSFVQGISFDIINQNAKLENDASDKLDTILRKIDPQWKKTLNQNRYRTPIFELLMNFAKFSYSPEWKTVRDTLSAGLSTEADRSEEVSNDLYQLFVNKNHNDFQDVQSIIDRLGIGAIVQTDFMKLDKDKREKNESLINSIREMNLILAVAGQFKNSPKIPLSLLIRTISRGKSYNGEYSKLNRILKCDSMVEYDNDKTTGNTLISFRHPGEALVYLEGNFLSEQRQQKEVEVLLELIRSCRWDIRDEAFAVTGLIRAFGTNSYGKVNDENMSTKKGHYTNYQEYWERIINEISLYASQNSDAMLILGHMTRDNVEQNMQAADKESRLKILKEVCDKMINAASYESYHPAACSRLYGEICRNLLEQMKNTDNDIDLNVLFEAFRNYFQEGIIKGKEAQKQKYNHFSLIQLLDIWLCYINEYPQVFNSLLADTLEYIDQLFYNDSGLNSQDEDFSNVLRHINDVYNQVGSMEMEKLRSIFSKSGNDSYAYCMAKQQLIKVYKDFQTEFDKISESRNGTIISSRIFFLNEYAADDFNFHSNHYTREQLENLFKKIKSALQKQTDIVISYLEENKNIQSMSYRCLLLYLKAKWLKYTGNLLMEKEQKPGLTEEQWTELYNICSYCRINIRDNEWLSRSIDFIRHVYLWVYTNENPPFQRKEGFENPNRILCLCHHVDNSTLGRPRKFHVSTYLNPANNKVYAKLESEIVDDGVQCNKIVRRTNIYVPENVSNYYKLKQGVANVSTPFSIWFNLGGSQIQDYNNEEV